MNAIVDLHNSDVPTNSTWKVVSFQISMQL